MSHAMHSNRPPEIDALQFQTDDVQLTRIFNTALITTSAGSRDESLSHELQQINQSPPFRAILRSVRELAVQENITVREAAEQIADTFRKVDLIWNRYVHLQGIDTLKTNLQGKN